MGASAGREADFRRDINALRALAVLAVIAFHFGVPGARAGYLGVDVFFVISGYLIGGHVASRVAAGTFSLAGFFAARIRRIVPALAVVCFAVLAWGWFYQLGPDYKALAWSARSSLLFVSNGLFAKSLGYFDLGSAYKPLLHTWSLSIEGQFYLLLPLFVLAIARLPAALRALAITAITALSFGAALYEGRAGAPQVFFSFGARAWELLAGCAVAWTAPWIARAMPGSVTLRKLMMGCGVAALVAACFLIPEHAVWPGRWTVLPVLATAAVIALGDGVTFGRPTSNPVVQQIGTISYSMYLWHWPVIVVWRLMSIDAPADAATLLALFAFTWVCAWLSWRFIEQPWRRAGARAPARAIGGWAGVATVLFVFSLVNLKTGGLPGRLPDYAQGANLAATYGQKLPGCRALEGAAVGEDPFACDIGDPRAHPPAFVIWGDSHALVYLDALRAARLPVSGYLFHRPACAPALPGASDEAACDRHNADVRGLLRANPSIRTIVITIRHADDARTAGTWNEARALAAQGYRVVFLGPLPEAHRAVPQEWGMRELVARGPIAEQTIPRDVPTRVEPFDARVRHWRDEERRPAPAGKGQLIPLDLQDLFCDNTKCWLVQGGTALLRDADHLTAAGAARVLPRLLGVLANSAPPA